MANNPANNPSNLVPLQGHNEANDLLVEQVLLGSIIQESGVIAEISDSIREDSFFNIRHQLIYKAMLNLYESSSEIDEITIASQLRATGTLEDAGGYSYLSELINAVPLNPNVVEYAKIIKNHHYMRKIMEITREISRRSADPQENLENILSDLESKITTIHGLRQEKSLVPISSILGDVVDLLEERSKNLDSLIGLETGFVHLDDITMGLQPADLIVVAARPSMGKTSFALNIATHAALNCNQPVLFFSLEMSKEQITMRILGSESEIDSHDLRRGNLSPDQWQKLFEVVEKIDKAPFFISDVAGMSVIDLISLARASASKIAPKLIVVDYLQLIRGAHKNNNREQEIAEISRSLKALAKHLNVPVIAVSQLNRGPEARANKRPNMADIRESGAVEQDADLILFLYRDEVYNPNTLDQGQAEVIIAKHRNGQIGTKKLAFLGKYTKFSTLGVDNEPNDPSAYEAI